jgi:hypothetical protein
MAKGENEQVRLSLTVSAYTRKQVRIAAAYADKEISEWAEEILLAAAEPKTGASRGVKK